MSCKRYERWVGLHAGGDLDAARIHKLEQHLEECAGCRGLLEGLRETRTAIEALRVESLDDSVLLDFRRRVLETIESEAELARPGGRGIAGWQWSLVGSVALLLLALTLFFFMPRSTEAPEQTAEDVGPAKGPTPTQATTSLPEMVEEPRVEERKSSPPQHAALRETEPPAVEPISPISPISPILEEPVEDGHEDDLVVKLVTDNPDVVIYWLVENNGG